MGQKTYISKFMHSPCVCPLLRTGISSVPTEEIRIGTAYWLSDRISKTMEILI